MTGSRVYRMEGAFKGGKAKRPKRRNVVQHTRTDDPVNRTACAVPDFGSPKPRTLHRSMDRLQLESRVPDFLLRGSLQPRIDVAGCRPAHGEFCTTDCRRHCHLLTNSQIP